MFNLLIVCVATLLARGAFAETVPLCFETTPEGTRLVAHLPFEVSRTLPTGRLTQEQGEAVLSLSLLSNDRHRMGPSMLGRYEHTGDSVSFTPRLALSAGATYRARLHVPLREASLDYSVPQHPPGEAPKVASIYPSARVLPANQLRFYIYFDRSMRGGRDLFNHLRLLNQAGSEIEAPWLEDEIWDEQNNCLVLYIHPGRIKRGVQLREVMGPVLHENQSYSLVVRSEWTDLTGNTLGRDTVKTFSTSAERRTRINLSDWQMAVPGAGTRDPLVLTMKHSLDYRSLLAGLTLMQQGGRTVEGTVSTGRDEASWCFTPRDPWQPGSYHVEVNAELEDVAGNTPERPFDLDLHSPREPEQSLRMPFQIAP